MRRLVRMFLIILLTTATAGAAAAAQGTPNPSGLDALGLPNLNVTVDGSTITGLPAETEANRYLVHVTVEGDALAGVEFARPEGMSIGDFVDALSTLHSGHQHGGDAMGHADDHGTAADDHGMDAMHGTAESTDGMPGMSPHTSQVFNATFAGGVVVAPGQTADVVVDLSPGEWIVTGGPDAPQQPVTLTVTGEMPATLPEPQSDATLSMGEYVIKVTEGELASGPQVVRVENIGAQPHFIDISRSSVDVTRDDVLSAIGAPGAGTPTAGSTFDINTDLQRVMTTTTQSHGVTSWVSVDLAPGTYVLQCHFPDIQDMQPHAMHGMVEVITIEQ